MTPEKGNTSIIERKKTPEIIEKGLYESRRDVSDVLEKSLQKSKEELKNMTHADLVDFAKRAMALNQRLGNKIAEERKINSELVKLDKNRQEQFKKMRAEMEKLKSEVTTDVLTQIHNRRYLNEEGPKEFERSERVKQPITVAMVDIDHFKAVNDEHDHDFGDQVLREVAQKLKNTVREMDIVARYGGEEFTLVFPETDVDKAWDVMERIRKGVEELKFEYKGEEVKITISGGLATFYPNEYQNKADNEYNNIEELIKRADSELYTAKESGRNRICCAEPKIPMTYADQEYLNQNK